MTILEVVQAPIHHDQTEHQVEPSAAVQERRHEAPQFKVVGDPVGEEGDPVGRDELQEDGEGDGEDTADDGARKGRDLGELDIECSKQVKWGGVRTGKETSAEGTEKEVRRKANGSVHAPCPCFPSNSPRPWRRSRR